MQPTRLWKTFTERPVISIQELLSRACILPSLPVDSSFLDDVSKRVNAADPDIVWVALGTPKQDFCTAALCKMVQRPCVGVGAAFDFVAGTISEAPAFFQKFGIEWIYRFASEPRRLWKRYVFGNFTFIRSALTESGN